MNLSCEKYRIPYMGSKQAIVDKIYNAINEDIGNTKDLFATNNINTIYDLFCGGGSVGYYFSQNGYKVYMNDIQKPLIELHEVLQLPQDKSPLTRELLYKWISREEYGELSQRQDWYGELIRCCWSFGNNGTSYLFSRDIEEYKKQGHDYCLNFKEIEGIQNTNKKDLHDRRKFLAIYTKKEFDKLISESKQLKEKYKIFGSILERKHTKEEKNMFCQWLRNTGIKCGEINKLTNSVIGLHYLSQASQQQIPTLAMFNLIKQSDKLKNIEIPDFINNLFDENWLKSTERLKNLLSLQRLQRLEQLQQLERLERLEQLQQLQQLERLQRLQRQITFTSKNYYEVGIKPNSIIYCDIPYINTAGYNKHTFDYNKFDNWVREMKNKGIRVYISEYTNHNNEWREVISINKYSLLNNSQETKTVKQEKLFCNI